MVIGFAAETGLEAEILKKAKEKMSSKNCDWIIANDAREAMGGEKNKVYLLRENHQLEEWPMMSKDEVAGRLFDKIVDSYS